MTSFPTITPGEPWDVGPGQASTLINQITGAINALESATHGSWLYGDGSDGALTLHDGDVLQPGYYTDITIVAGATITIAARPTRVPVIHCTGTWTIDGTVDLRGRDAVGRLNGTFGQIGFPFDTTVGTANASFVSGPLLGGDGGSGSTGTPMPPGSDPGAVVDTAVLDYVRLLAWTPVTSQYHISDYGAGGMGAGDNTNYGGAGGEGGSVFALVARHLVHGAASSYLIGGGKGGDGGDDGTGSTGHGNCGGGGGGAGGWWVTLSDSIAGSTATIGTGGAGGAGCGTGADGLPGMDGRGIHYLNKT